MKKLFAILICAVMCVTLLASCGSLKHEHTYADWISGEDGHFHPYNCGCPQEEIYDLHIDGNEDGICDACGYKSEDLDESPFTAYENLVTKDTFQKRYERAFNNRQPDYTEDFVYIYSNDYTEVYEGGEDKSNTTNRYEYDADSQIILYRHEYQSNTDDAANESYFWEYREIGGTVQFYDGRTGETETRTLYYDEFWEYAHNFVPFALFPNPYKLYDDKTYYIDTDEDGNTVFTLYSGDDDDYYLCQVVLTRTEMICRTKRYTKETDYEDTTIDIHRVYNADVSLTPISEGTEET